MWLFFVDVVVAVVVAVVVIVFVGAVFIAVVSLVDQRKLNLK